MKLLTLYRKVTGDTSTIVVPYDFKGKVIEYLNREIPYGNVHITYVERQCLSKVYFEDKTLQSVADEMGCSREHIRQRCELAIQWVAKQMAYDEEVTDDTPVNHIPMSNRALRALYSAGIYTVGELDRHLKNGTKLPNIGAKTEAELYDAMIKRQCEKK